MVLGVYALDYLVGVWVGWAFPDYPWRLDTGRAAGGAVWWVDGVRHCVAGSEVD